MWITNFFLHSFCISLIWSNDIPMDLLTGADWWSSRLHIILLISSVLLLELFLSPSSCWYHDSHSALHVSALNDHHVGIFLMSTEFFSITLIINNWWFSIMMLIILIKAHQANLEWMISWLQRPVISTLSSIFSFSAWFWVICFFSRNSSSVLLV